MPDNDKIQLPKGFKLDESVETPNVKLPKGFTLDTEVVKKKVGGEEYSLTKSPSISQEYLREGQGLADKGFIKTEKLDPSQLVSQYRSPDISLTPKPKKDYYRSKLEKGLIFDKEGKLFTPSSEALTKAISTAEEIDLKKPTEKDLVEKSREMAVVEETAVPVEKQGWLLNTVSALDKGFYKNFISNPIKGLGTLLQGATKKVLGGTGEGFISDKLIQYGDYLNKAIDELTPQDEEFKGTLTDQVSQALGQVGSIIVTGGIAGAGKGATAALVSEAPKGAVATATKALSSQLSSPTAVSAGLSMGQAEFDRAKEAGATDDQAFEAFYKNAVTGSVLETIPVMQFFKRFNNSTGGSVANYIKTKGVAGLTGGIEEMATEVMQQIYSNKTAKDIYNINQDILDGVGSSGGIGFGVGFVLNAMGANAKILRKQGREQEADVLENQIKQYEDNLENPKVTSDKKAVTKDIVTQGVEIGTQKAVQSLDRDLANNVITPEQYQEGIVFTEKAAQVVDKIPETVTGESKVKSVELLVERNDIKEANQILLQQKQATDEAYHAGIDQEIKANEERIKKIDSEVYNIAKKPSKEFGTKKYVVDGEEVSKEAFEALQGKPLGTKTVIKAEVKPEEVKLTEVKRIIEPSKPISEMNSEELYDFAIDTKRALKKQDKDFEGKTEKEKEDGGYYDVIDEVEDLRDASERINFIENAEDVNDLANSVKSTLSNIKGKEPNEYQLAILNAAKNKAIELGIDSKDLIKNIGSKIANQYKDVEDAELMVKSALEKLIPPQEVKPTEEVIVYHGGSVKDVNTEGGLFVSQDKNQAEAYAKSNKGKVQEFKINKKDISDENEVRNIIVELGLKSKQEGWDLSKELMLHEILDPRFETSLSNKDLGKLNDELVKRGYKAVEMMATDVTGNQRNVNDILVLNPKETLKSEVKPTEVKQPTKEQIDNLTKELLKVDYADADPKENPKSAKEFYQEIAKEYLENDLDIVEVVDYFLGGKERLQAVINGEAPKKTYKEAVKEKLEADKKRNREAGAERATVTKEIYRRVDQMDAPEDAEQIALRYLADGGKVSKEAVDEAYGSVKRAELNVKRRVSLSEEVKSKDFVQGSETLDQTAHRLWEANKQKIPETEIKDKLMAEIGNNNSRLEAAEAYLDKYNAEYKQEKEELRLAEQYKEQYLEEQAEIEKELRQPLDEQIEGEATEEHINNLINQYEAEIKGEDQQLRPESEGDVSKEASKGKVTEKTSETELAKEYKEAVGKASKKAKENAKKEFVDRNFDNIVEKLKIQIKCPT